MATSRRPKAKAVIVFIYGTILEKMEPLPAADERADQQPNLIGTDLSSLFVIKPFYLPACRKTRALGIQWVIGQKRV
jgi:hypothetical protein